MPSINENTLSQLNALDHWLGDVYDEKTSFSTLLMDAGFNEVAIEQIKQNHLSDFLQAVLDLLDAYTDLSSAERNSAMIQYYGLQDGKPQAFEIIGDRVGVGRERIRQLVNKRLSLYHDPERQAKFHDDFALIAWRLLGK